MSDYWLLVIVLAMAGLLAWGLAWVVYALNGVRRECRWVRDDLVDLTRDTMRALILNRAVQQSKRASIAYAASQGTHQEEPVVDIPLPSGPIPSQTLNEHSVGDPGATISVGR